MANDVNRLIDMLYERIEDAKSPALKPNMSMVDRDELLDLLDELRAQLRRSWMPRPRCPTARYSMRPRRRPARWWPGRRSAAASCTR